MASEDFKNAIRKATDEYLAAIHEGNFEKAREIREGLAAMESNPDYWQTQAEVFSEGNPDEEIAKAVEELEPAAGEVAEAALEAGRPDLAEEVVSQTLTTLADWAESAEELAETLEEVSEEIGDEHAEEVANEAADAAGEAAAAVEETLEEAGIPAPIAEELVDPANGTEVISEDVPPEPSHWLYRRRFGRVA